MKHISPRTWLFTALAVAGFAANSLLTRPALRGGLGDPSSFALIRVLSGSLVLAFLLAVSKKHQLTVSLKNSRTAVFLFLYMIFFSFGYVTITVGAGSLIAFSCVQITMLIGGFLKGDRMSWIGWTGFAGAMAGLFYLVSPGLNAPPLTGSLLMMAAGISWGFYSLLGKGSGDPLAATAGNFILAIPFAAAAAFFFREQMVLSQQGILLAVMSGGVSSALGYAFWYAALRELTTTQGAIVQLAAPVTAAIGGVLFLSEFLSLRLLISGPLILGGIYVVFRDESKLKA